MLKAGPGNRFSIGGGKKDRKKVEKKRIEGVKKGIQGFNR